MKRLFCLLLVFAMTIPAFAERIIVTGIAPTVSGTGAEIINGNVKAAFDKMLVDLNNQFNNIANPKKFLQAMGNSSVYASHGATTRDYGGYKMFSVTTGMMVGMELPKDILSIMNDLDGLSASLEREGDIKLGFSPNILNAHIGLNMGVFKFLPEKLGVIKRDDLYIGFRVGYFKLPDIIDDFNYKSLTLGITTNYQLVSPVSITSFIKWRGINIGSGFIYNGSKVSLIVPLDEISEDITTDGRIYMNPKAFLNLDTKTYTIPLEAVTAIKFLIFNIPLGVGADLAFGSTSLKFGINSDIELQGLPGYTDNRDGRLFVKGGVSNSPSFFNFKIMTGLGISAGPVVFDIPVTIYPVANGYSIGITIGAVF